MQNSREFLLDKGGAEAPGSRRRMDRAASRTGSRMAGYQNARGDLPHFPNPKVHVARAEPVAQGVPNALFQKLPVSTKPGRIGL